MIAITPVILAAIQTTKQRIHVRMTTIFHRHNASAAKAPLNGGISRVVLGPESALASTAFPARFLHGVKVRKEPLQICLLRYSRNGHSRTWFLSV
jgi:hypothetical protein